MLRNKHPYSLSHLASPLVNSWPIILTKDFIIAEPLFEGGS